MIWPKGMARNDPGMTRRELDRLLRRIRRLLARPSYRGSGPSARHLAEHCGVTDRTVRRWLAGEDTPDAWAIELLRDYAAVGPKAPQHKHRK